MASPLPILIALAAAALPAAAAGHPHLNSGNPLSRRNGVELVVQVQETRLRAWNRSDRATLLCFSPEADGTGGPTAQVVLSPGSFLDGSFPRGTLGGMRLEVVSLGLTPHASAGTFQLTEGILRVPAPGLSAWWETEEGSWPATAGPSAMPAFFRRALGDTSSPAAGAEPMHVPVITPSDDPGGDGPPVLEDKPLPPV